MALISCTRLKRRTRAESTDSTKSPAGSIQSPKTGKTASALPATKPPPNACRASFDLGNLTRYCPTLMCDTNRPPMADKLLSPLTTL
jgi:hypothetical protein